MSALWAVATASIRAVTPSASWWFGAGGEELFGYPGMALTGGPDEGRRAGMFFGLERFGW